MKMTLDEAIIHAKELSEDQSICKDCREEHEQLATWLEELKQYKDKECKMNPEQMFEKLGYTKCNDCTNPLYFKKDDPYAWINFNNKSVAISSQRELGYESLDYELIKAIIQQCIELGSLEEETCTNESEYDSRDVFKCSNCGFISVHHTGLKIDEDNRVESYYGYRPKYCPNCGSKIID